MTEFLCLLLFTLTDVGFPLLESSPSHTQAWAPAWASRCEAKMGREH